ncbi:MAG: DUF3108 domain-containing protein [Acidobacteria bacterium]|nr:DUF3108 domain-containing protein [Acidobacteriota bacterium]
MKTLVVPGFSRALSILVPGFSRALTIALALLVALSATAGAQRGAATKQTAPSSKSAAERSVPFKAGETLTYDVSWSNYLTAGTATVSVREKRPSFNSVAYYIVAEGRPTPLLSKLYTLYYKVDTLLDVFTLLPQRGSVYSEEGRRRRMKITRFDHKARRAQYEVQTATNVKQDLTLPPYSQDALSAVYVLRSIPLRAGGRMTMPVSDSGKTYRVQISVGAPEPVQTGIGSLRGWRITPVILDPDGKPEGRGMAIWLSEDARRLPLKMEGQLAVGRFVITLREAKG